MRTGIKISKRPRGRPRQYDPAEALDRAAGVFWSRGFAATSLDDLAAATGMNRPSLYNAFGDKEVLYRRALAGFVERMREAAGAALFKEPDLRKALLRFYEGALDVYFSSEPAPGCFVMCTAPVEAVERPGVREDLRAVLAGLDDVLAERFRAARAAGATSLDPPAAARIAQAVLHSLAIRARAGASKAALRKMANEAVKVLCR
jgi:TetR/AcrR family transcriptional regulator, copper-responsive repressor